MKTEMTGYNDEKAIAIYSTIKLMPFILGSFIFALVSSIPALIFKIYFLLIPFILPVLLLLCLALNWIVNLNYKRFLNGLSVKHVFCLENGKLLKDGKEVKTTDRIKIYKFKKFLFLELKKSYYRIGNDDFISGNREEFLSQVKFVKRHFVIFTLPQLSEEQIIELLLNEIDPKETEKIFLSPDKRKIIYIFRKDNGIYSVGSKIMKIADEYERLYTKQYGWWIPDGTGIISFYGTVDEALNDIKSELSGYTEIFTSKK